MPPLKFNNPSCVVGVECAVVRKYIYAVSYTCTGESIILVMKFNFN